MSSVNHNLHDSDFYAWTKETAQLLKEGRVSEVDIKNIAEELESMGNSDKRALISCFSVLIAHLLKWKHQKEKRSKSWSLTIKNQRVMVKDLLKDSPSLKHQIQSKIEVAYTNARLMAEKETGLNIDTFPEECPFTLEQCLNEEFWPD